MASKTKIQWTQATWNPVVGCTKVSPGCDNCYAERMAHRLNCMGQNKYQGLTYGKTWGNLTGKWTGVIYCDESALEIPLHWRKSRMIFVCSMSDLFHKSVPVEFVDKMMAIITLCRQHTFQVLTKRPAKMAEYIKRIYKNYSYLDTACRTFGRTIIFEGIPIVPAPINNLWLGVTAENPDYKSRIDILRQIPAVVRFISIEPCLADMGDLNLEGIDWVIIGAESGPGARYCSVKNIRGIVEQCKAANVKCFVKQIHQQYYLTGGGQKLIKDIDLFPEDLRIRQYPKKAR